MLYLETAEDGQLGTQNCKKFSRATCMEYSDTKLVQIIKMLFVSYFAIYSNGSHLDWSIFIQISNNSMQESFSHHFVKIHSAVIETLSFSCLVLFIITADGGHLGIENSKKIAKKIEKASYTKHSGTKFESISIKCF